MICFSKILTKKYAMDFSCLHFIRKFNDGITFFDFSINLDFYEDNHNPRFSIIWIILNFKVFEFEIYNRNHEVFKSEAFAELKKELKL